MIMCARQKLKCGKKIKKYKNAKFDRFRPRRRFGIVGVVAIALRISSGGLITVANGTKSRFEHIWSFYSKYKDSRFARI